MQLEDYLNDFLATIAAHPYVESKNISFEERPPDAAYIKGTITFIVNSIVQIKEFVVFNPVDASVLKYGYHYLNKNGNLIFRYDNAFDPKAANFYN